MYIVPIKFIVQLFVVYIVTIKDVTSSPFGDKNQSKTITNEGLYNASDYVLTLNISNLKTTIYGSKNAWVVEFYSSWCGHCQRFAPIWKSLARDIKSWWDIIGVAAIDCANEDNNPLCREYEIMSYPMIKYFSPDSKPGAIGIEVAQVKNEEILKNYVIERLQKDQEAGNGLTWPNITPYRSSEPKDIWKGVPASVVYKFLLFEETDSYLGSEIILDFHNITKLLIRRVTSDHQILCMNYQITVFPNLVAIDRGSLRKKLKIITPTRSGVAQLIGNFVKSKGLTINISKIIADSTINKSDNMKKSETLDGIKVTDDEIDQVDVESAVQYSLENEIPLHSTIDDGKLKALKEYLAVLAQYLPLKSGNSAYFNQIQNALDDNDSITGENFYRLVKSTEKNMSPVYTTNVQWIRCKGSNSRLRGYPCGLWTLFHTLTANYAAANTQNTPLHAPARILSAMHGYISYFFGCADCSEHFINMAEKLKLFAVKSADEAVLWLWQAHNIVNERLSGDITEDPEFPKLQYPSKVHCMECRDNDNEWNLTKVLKYLKKKYTHTDIQINNASEPQFLKLIRTDLPMNKNMTYQQKTSWDFTLFDISICVALYITSAAILILVCIKFLVKRTSKKKIQVHSLFLRV